MPNHKHRDRRHQCPYAHHDSPAIHEALNRIAHYHDCHSVETDIDKWIFTEDNESPNPKPEPVTVVYVTSDKDIIYALDLALKTLNEYLKERNPTDAIQ